MAEEMSDDASVENVDAEPRLCPFCGSDKISVYLRRSGRKHGYQCMCRGCHVGQTRNYYSSRGIAVRAWNKRTDQPGAWPAWKEDALSSVFTPDGSQ